MRLSLVLLVLLGCVKRAEPNHPVMHNWEMNDDIILPEDEDLDYLPEADSGSEEESHDPPEDDSIEEE